MAPALWTTAPRADRYLRDWGACRGSIRRYGQGAMPHHAASKAECMTIVLLVGDGRALQHFKPPTRHGRRKVTATLAASGWLSGRTAFGGPEQPAELLNQRLT